MLHVEHALMIRVFLDHTFVEAYFQGGRVAATVPLAMDNTTSLALRVDGNVAVQVMANVTVYPMRSIWTTPEAVRAAPRVYM